MKRIVICADGTWNRPEQYGKDGQHPTNVLKFARGIAHSSSDGTNQVVFYDWGIGSYHGSVGGGAFGKGLEKNVMDGYRFLVHNYNPGDQIFLFGFSRGAYTVRSLSGLINNCHILKASEAHRVEEAFEMYKDPKHKPNGDFANNWKQKYSIPNSGDVHFIGVWDTVGSVGLPVSFFGLIEDKHRFYDNKLGSNIKVARHALSLDERRDDFEPTIWQPRPEVDLKQVWFAGVHADIGGSYAPDDDGSCLSDISMCWLVREAEEQGLAFEDFLSNCSLNPHSRQHDEYEGLFRFLGKYERQLPNDIPTKVHRSVKQRYEGASGYRSLAIDKYLEKHGQWPEIED